jgi:hypothetical protein
MPGHRGGTNLFAGLTGAALIVLALSTFLGWSPNLKDPFTAKVITGGASAIFGVILLAWVAGEGKPWGIGFEGATMVVGFITAVIAILTWVHL